MVPLALRTICPLCAGFWIRCEKRCSVVIVFVQSSINASSTVPPFEFRACGSYIASPAQLRRRASTNV